MTSPAALLINARAVAAARDPSLPRALVDQLGPAASAGLVAVTEDEGEVPPAIERFAARGARLICIFGGDGTILSALSAVIARHAPAALPRIGLIRGGTINTLAKYLRIQGRPVDLLARLLRRHRRGAARLRRVGVIRVDERHGLTFGAALMGRFYHDYNQLSTINRLAVTGYVARVVLSAVFDTARARRLLAPVPASVEVDGATLPQAAFSVIVASCMENHGFGVKPTYRGASLPGHFQLIASAKGRAEIAAGYHRLLRGVPFSGADHFDAMVRRARITFERPELCMLDGEVFEAREVELQSGPELEFALP